jgi:hypothetical protein
MNCGQGVLQVEARRGLSLPDKARTDLELWLAVSKWSRGSGPV